MLEKGQALKSMCPPFQARAWPCPVTVPFRVKVKGPADWKKSLIQAHIMQEEIPVLLLSSLRGWPSLDHFALSFYQMSSELVSNLSSSLPQTASFCDVPGEFGRRPIWTQKNESAPGQKFFQSSWLSEIWGASIGPQREAEKAQHWKPLWIRVSKPLS